MRELRQYAEPVLKIICLILAVFVVVELAGIFIRWNPFRGVTLPEVPSLAAGTNAPSTGGRGTNPVAIATVKGTNNPHALAGTNAAPALIAARSNSISPSTPAANESNSIAHTETAKAGPIWSRGWKPERIPPLPRTQRITKQIFRFQQRWQKPTPRRPQPAQTQIRQCQRWRRNAEQMQFPTLGWT